jgi:hypothetical protein
MSPSPKPSSVESSPTQVVGAGLIWILRGEGIGEADPHAGKFCESEIVWTLSHRAFVSRWHPNDVESNLKKCVF